MAALEHYSFSVLLHILGALGLFVALALEWFAVHFVLPGATSPPPTVESAHTLSLARRIGALSMALIVVPGLAMAFTRWNFLAWPAAGLLGMAAMVMVGCC